MACLLWAAGRIAWVVGTPEGRAAVMADTERAFARQPLRLVFFAQEHHAAQTGRYTADLAALAALTGESVPAWESGRFVLDSVTATSYVARFESAPGVAPAFACTLRVPEPGVGLGDVPCRPRP